MMFDCESMLHRLGVKEVYKREHGSSYNQLCVAFVNTSNVLRSLL